MKICPKHWEQLKHAIKVRGLFDFVSASGSEMFERVLGDLQGEQTTRRNFDPLMACNNSLFANALQYGGLYLMMQQEDGTEYCPVCEANKHGQEGWIDLAADSAAEYMKTLPP